MKPIELRPQVRTTVQTAKEPGEPSPRLLAVSLQAPTNMRAMPSPVHTKRGDGR